MPGGNKPRLLVPALLVAGAIAVGYALDRPGTPPVERLRDFDEYALFWAGESVAGLPLSAVSGTSFIYGTCDRASGSEGGCMPPAQVQVWSACDRNISMYHPSAASPVPPRGPGRRGVRLWGNGGSYDLQTADATVVIYARTNRLALKVIDALRRLNNGARAGAPLPRPVPGALTGTLHCDRKPARPGG